MAASARDETPNLLFLNGETVFCMDKRKLATMKNFITILILTFLFSTYPSAACSCDESETLKESISTFIEGGRQRLIFNGKVVYHGPDSDMNARGRYPIVNVFKIESSWLGLDKYVNFIRIFEGGHNCDFTFKQDSTYLVYAYTTSISEAPYYGTSTCTETKLFSLAAEDVAILGRPEYHEALRKPIQTETTAVPAEQVNLWKYISIFSIILNLLALVLLNRKKQKHL